LRFTFGKGFWVRFWVLDIYTTDLPIWCVTRFHHTQHPSHHVTTSTLTCKLDNNTQNPYSNAMTNHSMTKDPTPSTLLILINPPTLSHAPPQRTPKPNQCIIQSQLDRNINPLFTNPQSNFYPPFQNIMFLLYFDES